MRRLQAVPEPHRTSKGPRRQRILLCYDGSPESRRALTRVAELATRRPADVTVISVAEPLYHGAPYSGYADPGESATHRHLLDEASETLAAVGVAADTLEPADEPARAIVDAARDLHADLIVVGSGRRAHRPRPLRTVSGELVARAPSDVLVVR
jgi:nucleotide-binding universal stress UspA family protein